MSTARVDFTRAAAERIANVVRVIERGNRDEAPLRFSRALELAPQSKLATFITDWPTGNTQVITLHNVTSTPNTLVAINLSVPVIGLTNSNATSRFVIVSRAKGTATAVAVEIQQLEGCLFIAGHDLTRIVNFKKGEVQILGHDGDSVTPCLKWLDVYTCPATTA